MLKIVSQLFIFCRTSESFERHVESCTFEIDSSSTSDDDQEESCNLSNSSREKISGNKTTSVKMPLPGNQQPSIISESSLQTSISSSNTKPNVNTTKTASEVGAPTRFQLPADEFQLPAVTQTQTIDSVMQSCIPSSNVEPPLKKSKITSSTFDGRLPQSVADKFMAPPCVSSPIRFSGVLKKSGAQRRYSNTKLVRGGRGYQVKRHSPALMRPPVQQGISGTARMPSLPAGTTLNPNLSSDPLRLSGGSQVTYVPTNSSALQQLVPHGASGPLQIQHLPAAAPTAPSPVLPGQLNTYQPGNVEAVQPQHITTFHTQHGQPIQISIPAYAANSNPATNVLDLNKVSEARNVGYPCSQILNSSSSPSQQLLTSSGYSNLTNNPGMPLRVMSRPTNFNSPSPQSFTVQYVNSFNDPQQPQMAGQLVTGYQGGSVVVQQPLLQQQQIVQPIGSHQVLSPRLVQQTVMPSPGIVQPGLVQPPLVQQSPVVVPQVVNSNITYTINSPKTYVINQQPSMLPQQSAVQVIQQGLVPHSNLGAENPVSVGQLTSSSIPSSNHQSQFAVLPELGNPSKPESQTVRVVSVSEGSMPMVRPQTHFSRNVVPLVQRPSRISFSNSTMTTIPSSSSRFSLPTPKPHQTVVRHKSPFGASGGVVRTVATVAPAIVNSTVLSSGTRGAAPERDDPRNVFSNEMLDDADSDAFGDRPRPTYSYRDAMNRPQILKKKPRSEVLLKELQHHIQQPNNALQQKLSITSKPRERKQDFKENSRPVDKDSTAVKDMVITQPYKLVLKRDSANECGFNVLPVEGSNTDMENIEVKELRIKAKVSLGPKRKKTNIPLRNKEVFYAPKDITHDGLVNEQNANFSPPSQNQTSLPDDSQLFDKPKTANSKSLGNGAAEPFIVFELTSEDGFKVESRHLGEVWQTVFDAVNSARASLKMGQQQQQQQTHHQSIDSAKVAGEGMSGLHMLGLTHNAVQYLLEQLPGANDCQKYSFQFHRRHREEGSDTGSPSGCVRTESFKSRSPYDLFSWLASQHRKLPETDVLTPQEEIQLSTR